ncbi:hypothetical protein [Streptomyces sp. NPDC048142]|uniref:hypothetical protein n=1 Tax=Streptomyces sp. NPDC048142 TaxID=3365501 RepID=UPI00371B4060
MPVEHVSLAPWSWRDGHEDVRFPALDDVRASLRPGDGWRTERSHTPWRTATGPGGETATVSVSVSDKRHRRPARRPL